jgi:hypothetical protein
MLEFLFCPQHGIITSNWPLLLVAGGAARLYAYKLVSVVQRWWF